jgi:Cu/Ag efflux pump CusA
MVGFITLFGIAVRNGILLVNHYRYLRIREHRSIREAVVQGSMERLVPILMTALTAALALIPIVLQGDEPGNEILAPLSVVILGGLLSSTFLNLIVIPAGYETMERLLGTDPDDLADPTIASAYTTPSEEPHTPEDEPDFKNA